MIKQTDNGPVYNLNVLDRCVAKTTILNASSIFIRRQVLANVQVAGKNALIYEMRAEILCFNH